MRWNWNFSLFRISYSPLWSWSIFVLFHSFYVWLVFILFSYPQLRFGNCDLIFGVGSTHELSKVSEHICLFLFSSFSFPCLSFCSCMGIVLSLFVLFDRVQFCLHLNFLDKLFVRELLLSSALLFCLV